ncbi:MULTISPECIES: AAA family ATPase [Leptolyngbya]|uniref:AAA family ATPase n=1 Tax=Leptolyngbya TaxID=47251 RepID=UPI001683CC62|nr:AAA family ATPase [Leptolyngbya sp. FACHB-1624]MBD1859465.1 AAA family ATPase [Leptolyngbya sp. FACHB-1624]
MSQPVPKLDLAPKLRRPLSLWNPLDYVRLLYWVFYFPQALRWYVNEFAWRETAFDDIKSWHEKLQWVFNNPVQAKLYLQGLILQIATPFLICYLLEVAGLSVSWFRVALGTTLGAALGATLASNITSGVASGIASGIASSIPSGVALGISLGIALASYTAFSVLIISAFGVASGVALGVAFGVTSDIPSDAASDTAFSMVVSASFFVAIGISVGVISGRVVGAVVIAAFGVLMVAAFGVAILRPENWLWGLHPGIRRFQQQQWLLPRITLLPIPSVEQRIFAWMQQDWEAGLKIANELLTYTLQFTIVIQAVNSVLAKTPPNSAISQVASLSDLIRNQEIVKYASVSLNTAIKAECIDTLLILPKIIKQIFPEKVNTNFRFNSPTRAAAAGFWFLYQEDAKIAIEAFQVVEDLPHGKEMLLLATILDRAQVSDLQQIATLNLPPTPHPPLLRPESWNAIAAIRRASEDIRVVCNAASRTARAFASNRALGDLNSILEAPDQLPKAERKLILSIARTWRDSLLKSVGEIGRIEILKPVQNPYIAGDPVEGSLFVGRDDILKQLEELWFMSDRLQSVVLYGHRRMGKTSLLRNINDRLGSNTQLIYVNLLNLGEVTQGAGEVLLSICDEIAQATNHPAPSDTDLINLPYPTFRRYLQSLIQSPDSKGLIIALDEFEKLEDLITAEKLSPDFLSYLRGLVQMSPKIAFAFAGLHTLEEMTEDYFSPFFASVIPIRLSFLDRASTRQLLANPSDDFPLDYAPDLYDEIFDLTAGQPYLVQLLGFQLVRRYNAQVFEQGRDRSHQFSIDDLTTITESSDLYDNGRYYFTGVWQQTAQSPPGQQDILKAIAHQGLSRDVLLQQFDPAQFDTAIEALRRHDVVHEVNQTWCIKVELFRRWVVKYALT